MVTLAPGPALVGWGGVGWGGVGWLWLLCADLESE